MNDTDTFIDLATQRELPHETELARAIKLHSWVQRLTPADFDVIRRIVHRVRDIFAQHQLPLGADDLLRLQMDLGYAHVVQPLALMQLLMSSDDDITHDVCGIGRTIDRSTGHLKEGFRPRHLARLQ